MATNCKNEQISRDGSGQPQRFLPALDASLALLDDRKPEDLLLFAKHYAKLVRFYDVEDHPNEHEEKPATWQDFFNDDIAVVVASIAQYKNKIDLLRQDFESKLKMKGDDPPLKKYAALFDDIAEKLIRIHKWYERSIPDHPLKKELEVKIRSALAPALEKLIAYKQGLIVPKEEDFVTSIEKHESIFTNEPWNIDFKKIKTDDSIYVGSNQEQKMEHAALYIDDIFLVVLKAYKDLAGRSDFYMNYALESYPEHQPHMALFIAFVQLFAYAQKELNGLTSRHLEFYYRDVLRLHERVANPDAVYMIYELAKEATEYDLKKGTPLTAGKDGTGKEMIYKTETDLVINKAKVKELKTIFLDKNISGVTPAEREQIRNIYARPVANSEDGFGMPFKIPETAWSALGYFDSDGIRNIFEEEAPAEIGFAIASPQLFLAEGTRIINIQINKIATLADIGKLNIYLTGEKGEWLKIDKVSDGESTEPKYYAIEDNTIIVTLQSSEPPIVAYDQKLHGGDLNTRYPVIRVVIDPVNYEIFKTVIAKQSDIAINVKVRGVKNLNLANEDGSIDPTKSFNPFTLTPKPNSGFFIGSKEVFSKKLKWLKLVFNRKINSPTQDQALFKTLSDIFHIAIDSFAVESDLFYDRDWDPLFYNDGKDMLVLVPQADAKPGTASLSFDSQLASNINKFDRVTGDRLLNSTPDVFQSNIKLSLHYFNASNINDSVIASILIPTENGRNSFPIFQVLSLLLELNAVSIDYYSEQGFEQGVEQFFHIYPFGTIEISPAFDQMEMDIIFETVSEDEDEEIEVPVYANDLLPQFKFGASNIILNGRDQYSSAIYQQGNLYIGIENLVPPQNLSLLFKIADGTAEDNDEEPPAIHWSYLVNNKWRPLPVQNIVSDSTYGLQTTGIVLIDFPKNANTTNSIITKGLHWLCLSVDAGADKIPKIIDVIAQANKAIFFDQQNDPEHFRNPLPAKTISKLVTKVPEVKLITQLFESFDGKMREEGRVFYARASERLRHKHRAITAWDYEHLVLQHFPWIYKVKCLVTTDYRCLCRHPKDDATECCCGQLAPGHVLIVPISNLRNRNAVDILKPRTGRRTLIQIEEYLKKLTSPFVHVHAKNPVFEEIRVSFKVKFHTGTDKGRYLKQLNEDIVGFLSPWAFDETKEIMFGGKIYASNIINYIEERDYVDYITCFRMIHIVDGCCDDDTLPDIDCAVIKKEPDFIYKGKKLGDRFMTEIGAHSPRAILTSVKKHCIELVDESKPPDDCHCGDH